MLPLTTEKDRSFTSDSGGSFELGLGYEKPDFSMLDLRLEFRAIAAMSDPNFCEVGKRGRT